MLAAARRIGDYPLIAPERPEFGPPPLRLLVLPGWPYVLAYDAAPDARPVIQRVLHTSRDVPPLLARALGELGPPS